jgi:Xaa-Pro aminopeptidase
VNERQKLVLYDKISKYFGGNLRDKVVALWGLSFKPNTNDMREATSRVLMEALWRAGARVQAYDPAAMQEALRLYKSRDELRLMRQAATIAAAGHLRAMRLARPGRYEHEVEAELLHAFRSAGAVPSYEPIVGGGANACVLHYRANNAPLRDGDLLLVDAGAEVDCYASDITRTYPVNGRFSPEQRALYDVVLAAQHAAIAAVRPGQPWTASHDAAVKTIATGLCEIGLIKGSPRAAMESGAYKAFFPHKTGHWLGLDVHDVGDYRIDGEPRVLEPGMVLTVEPGIYIAPEAKGVAAKWRGIGIRIEDDVVVTSGAAEVLTDGVPKEPDEIEALMARS